MHDRKVDFSLCYLFKEDAFTILYYNLSNKRISFVIITAFAFLTELVVAPGATFFAVSDDLKQRVSKVQGTFYNNLQSLHINLPSCPFKLKGLK
jgi:hypothetical protein